MTAVYIILGILLFFFLLSLLRIGVRADFAGDLAGRKNENRNCSAKLYHRSFRKQQTQNHGCRPESQGRRRRPGGVR